MDFDPKRHWEKVYQEKEPGQVSWYQTQPGISLDLIALSRIGQSGKIIDVGGGASVLVDKLFEKGFNDVTVLDISSRAIEHAKERLGKQSEKVTWIEADITSLQPSQQYDLWHDRAVFHFLTDPVDRKVYVEVMEEAVKPNGYVIIATFALEGPPKCSGLNVERYDPEKLSKEIGNSFTLLKSVEETHTTPWRSEQKFAYCLFKKQRNFRELGTSELPGTSGAV